MSLRDDLMKNGEKTRGSIHVLGGKDGWGSFRVTVVTTLGATILVWWSKLY